MSYIHTIGIDYHDHHYTVYIQLINFSFLTSQAKPSAQDQGQAVVEIGTGKTVVDAIRDIYKQTSRRLLWGHLSAVVFSESGLKHGLTETLEVFSRYHEIRYTLWMFATNDSLQQILTTFPPSEISEVSALLGEPVDSARQSTFTKPLKMFEFIRQLDEPGSTVIMPRLDLSKEKWDNGKKKARNLIMANTVILTRSGFKGDLLAKDSKGLLFFISAERFFIYINLDGGKTTTLTISKPKPHIVAHYKNGQPSFDFNVKAKAVIEVLDKNIPINQLHKKAVKHITELINHTYQESLKKDIDIYNLSHTFYHRYPTIWHKLEQNGQIQLTKDSLHIHVDLKLINSYKANYKTIFTK